MNALVATLHEREGTFERCLYLIRKHAPLLMRAGGGALKQETRKEYVRMTDERLAEAKRLAASGTTHQKIAEHFGCSQSTVTKALLRNGVPSPASVRMAEKRKLIERLILAGKTQKQIIEIARCDSRLVPLVRASLK